jgi:CHAT domain-containing protein
MSSEDWSRFFEAIERAITSPEAGAGTILEGLFESLYRSELSTRLSQYVSRTPIARPWCHLLELATALPEDRLEPILESLDAVLPSVGSRAALVLRTEAARHLSRLTGDFSAAWLRLEGALPPSPALGDAAVDGALVGLRLAASTGKWNLHDDLAAKLVASRIHALNPGGPLILVVIAEHDILRGAYAAALTRLDGLETHPDPAVQLAALSTRLHVLVSCAGYLPNSLRAEIDHIEKLVAPLLEIDPESSDSISSDEWRERQRRYAALLHFERSARDKDPKPDAAELSTGTLAWQAAMESLSQIEAALAKLDAGESREVVLRLRLRWAGLSVAVSEGTTAESCEALVSSILVEADALGLPIIEILAWDQRARIRSRNPRRLEESVADAGGAASLAAHLLEANRGSAVERPLRATLLPVFDGVVKLLVEKALDLAASERDSSGRHERFGRAILDHVEQSMELALAESRRLAGSEAERKDLETVHPRRCQELQMALRHREAVLQYFLVGTYLLVFAYTRNRFVWHAEAVAPDNRHPLPVRKHLESFFPLEARSSTSVKQVATRELDEHDAPRPKGTFEEKHLQDLGECLLPSVVVDFLGRQRVRRLAIVPHDVLYRVPFGRLPWSRRLLWRRTLLGRRFSLSLQPTGSLAVSPSPVPWQAPEGRVRIGFFKGPGLDYTDREQDEIALAFQQNAEIVAVDTTKEEGAFTRQANDFDVLYLACHGSRPNDKPGEKFLELGPPGERVALSQVGCMKLNRCGLAVLQSCWTGWMDHVREDPVHGFPQGLRDAGVAAVVAPMFPVDDSLCPIFTAVLCRALCFLRAGEALRYSLKILHRHGRALVSRDFKAAEDWDRMSGFARYEYRFTGDPSVDLREHWRRRPLAWARFQFRIWRQCFPFYLSRLATARPWSGRPAASSP